MVLIIILLVIGLINLSCAERNHSGGIHVKPRSNTPKPKIRPAPQSGRTNSSQ